ncbi:MAG: aldehyde ferredoxin oxidoreductase family protein [Deltaproteobacteria bacterium]|nr:MAG: aldehyde ferredoxin oxidoreductase family protein [Deltaproteobacteria bacterium]
MFGLMGKILRVNLTDKNISEERIPEEVAKKFLGGRGIASKYLFDEVKSGIDPLGPENKLIFMSGLLAGTPSPSAGRYSVVAKSPLTNIWAQSNSGGRWGVDLKHSGFDGIIFEGISEKPVYLVIDDGQAEIRDADDLWGKNVTETTGVLKEKLGNKFNVAAIGTAGENLVKYAAIMNDIHRAAGRCGLGAVMGSKRLKAIAVNGTMEIKIADKKTFQEISKKQYELLGENILGAGLQGYGTTLVLDIVNVCGGLPTRNWQTGVCSFAEDINGESLSEKVLVDAVGCFACPIKCGRRTEIKKGPYTGEKGEGPEYETVAIFGAMCDNSNLEAITMANYLCNDYGLDTISCGSTIAFTMECFEKGILKTEDTGGMEISFGNSDAIIELVHRIAKREGVGDLLAEGTRIMAQRLGQGSERFAMHVKGLELPAYDSRAAKITGLAFATANRGGDHVTGYVQGPTFLASPFLVIEESEIEDPLKENPAETKVVKDLEDALTVFDAVGSCKFMGMASDAQEISEIIAAVTGWKFEVEDFRKIGERIYNLERAFNVREGLTRAEDTLPKRLLEEPLPEGPAEGNVNNLGILLDPYYEFRGWDKTTGKPTPEKLRELGLENVIKQIYGSKEQ